MRGCSFNGLKLGGEWVKVNLHGMRASQATFKAISFTNCSMQHAEFDDCTFASATLQVSPLTKTQWRSCKLSGVTFASLDMCDSVIISTSLANVKFLDGVNLLRLSLQDVSLSHVTVTRAPTTMKHFTTAMCNASFTNVTVASSTFDNLDLSDATLTNSSSKSTHWNTLSIERAKVNGCAFEDCVFKSAHMRSVTWSNCRLEKCKLLLCDLRSDVFKGCVLLDVIWGLGSQEGEEQFQVKYHSSLFTCHTSQDERHA